MRPVDAPDGAAGFFFVSAAGFVGFSAFACVSCVGSGALAGVGEAAADRLTAVLSATTPFAGAKVAGSIKTDRQTGGVSFDVSIPLATGESDS